MDSSWLCFGLAVCGFLGAAVASSKNRAGTGLVLGLLLGPIGVLVAALLGDASKGRNDPRCAVLPVTCSSCKGVVQSGDPACPHCGADRPPMRGKHETRRGWPHRLGRKLGSLLRR